MRVVVAPDYEALTLIASKFIADAVNEKGDAVLALPTGTTPLGVYRRLVLMHHRGEIDFSRVTTFNLDEFVGFGPDNPLSRHAYMSDNFFSKVGFDPARACLPNGLAEDPQAECHRYEQAIAAAGGLDLAVLGIGLNGRVGFNEPGTPAESRTRPVRLSREALARLQAEMSPEPAGNGKGNGTARVFPMSGLTVGLATLMEAKRILLLAAGEDKAEAVAAALDGPIDEELPASAFQRHPSATFVIDREAATDLE